MAWRQCHLKPMKLKKCRKVKPNRLPKLSLWRPRQKCSVWLRWIRPEVKWNGMPRTELNGGSLCLCSTGSWQGRMLLMIWVYVQTIKGHGMVSMMFTKRSATWRCSNLAISADFPCVATTYFIQMSKWGQHLKSKHLINLPTSLRIIKRLSYRSK